MNNFRLVFFLFSVSVFCQQKTIGEFTELIIKDGLHVTLISGDKNAISITSKNNSYQRKDIRFIRDVSTKQ